MIYSNRMFPPLQTQHLRIVEILLEMIHIHRSGHDENFQRWLVHANAACLDFLHDAEQNVSVDGALVTFVQNDYAVVAQGFVWGGRMGISQIKCCYSGCGNVPG
jgi:hypothetical protein